MRDRSGLAAVVLTGVAVLAAAVPAAAKPAAGTPCAGRFVVEAGKARSLDPIIDIDSTRRITIRTDCGPAPVKTKATRDGWRMTARWKRCGGIRGLRLQARTDRACRLLRVRLRTGTSPIDFTAAPSRCGDGMVDGVSGEQCDPPGTPGCAVDCARSCNHFDSTWAAIEQTIFARHGCTAAACHGGGGTGGLDLRPGAAYTNLVNVAATADPTRVRLVPGDEKASLLWRKVNAGTSGIDDVPGSPMPLAPPALSADEVEALRLWIRRGANQVGDLPAADALLDACVPPGPPPAIVPSPPPAPDKGVQLYAPPWQIPAGGEGEVCFSTYYDFEDQIRQHRPDALVPCPEVWGGAGKTCFAHNRNELTQSPNSHHSIVRAYRGTFAPTHSGFGAYTCHGGPKSGEPCNPTGIGTPAPAGADCGPRSGCAGDARSTIACNLYGPPDFGFTFSVLGFESNAPSIIASQAPHLDQVFPPSVYTTLPTKGVMVWNSHAFNTYDVPTTNEQWLNLSFAGGAERQYPVVTLADDSAIFSMSVPPFQTEEICNTHFFEKGTRLFELSSHFHKRGKLFRVWDPDGSLVLTTTEYTDPEITRFDPPVALDSDDPQRRGYRYCAIYDNGATTPAAVKRRSTSPDPPFGVPGSGLGGPCGDTTVACLGGPHQGALCHGDNRQCGDGRCDACPVGGGVTTEDEMFILGGAYYLVPTP